MSRLLPLLARSLVLAVTLPLTASLDALPGEESATEKAISPPLREPSTDADSLQDEAASRRIRVLIENLGSSFARVRDSAEKELRGLGYRAVPALLEAREDTRAERALRARRILAELLRGMAVVVDALGDPVAGCTLELSPADGEEVTVTATRLGHVPLPDEPDKLRGLKAQISHPDYGRAVAELEEDDGAWQFQAALVRRGTPASERALEGRVLDPDDRPVADVLIQCTEVRTPGEGLIPSYGSWRALTDKAGHFQMYVPARKSSERGDLIPPSSRYHLALEPPESAGLFPSSGRFLNTAPVKVRLERPERFFVIEFEGLEGKRLLDAEELSRVSMTFQRQGGQDRLYLGARFARAGGGRLLPGTYVASLDGREYSPIELTPQSPDKVVFRFPPPVVFAGRVVDGISGASMPGAFILAFAATSRQNLALLDDGDWKRLHDLPVSPPVEDPAVKILDRHYGVLALTRSDEDGQYEITQPRGEEFYALLAFQQHFLPYRCRTYRLPKGDDGRTLVDDLPLYPAARMLVRPVVTEGRLSVSPRWLLEKEGQPRWMTGFRAVWDRRDRGVEYVHWLENNEQQPVFIPAGSRLRLRFETPYDDKWAPAESDRVLRLDQGEIGDLGEIHFPRALPAEVLVVDEQGEPVEGIPVRRRQGEDGAWCVAHNTDADGIARFHLYPNSSGQFRVSDLPRDSKESRAANLTIPFEVEETGEGTGPYRITLTARQIELLLGRPAERS